MNNNYDHIHIFRSNISCGTDIALIGPAFDRHPAIEQWSVDIDDEDHVLRVVSHTLTQKYITDLVKLCGYTCEEMNDTPAAEH